MQRSPSTLTIESRPIKSPEYFRFREQLKTATELQQDVPLDIVINYLGPDLGLIDRLQRAAENTLLLAQDKTGSHQAYECILQMAFYYQAAWALAKRYQLANYYPAIVEQLKNLEQVFPKLAFEVVSLHDEKQMIIRDFQLHYQNNNQHKKTLLAIRDFAKKQLKIYQEQSNNSDLKMMTSGAAPKPVSMQAIYSNISQKIRTLFTAIISESIVQYQKLTGVYSPCAYSFIALGSLAREEITPYSDIEFGILIEDKLNDSINNKNKVYFRNLCRLINFKLLALAETPANFISKEFGEKVGALLGAEKHALIPKGFCFDAFIAGGYKNPLGKRDEKGELIFELIGTPSELADYQDEKHYGEKGKLVSELLLPGSLTQARLIISSQTNEQLLKQYEQKVSAYLNQRAKQLWGKPLDSSLNLTLYQARALELLVADIGRFRPKLGKQEEGGRSFAAKHDLYRLPNMMFDQLALYFNLTETNLWEQLNALASSTTAARPALFNAAATKNLARAIDRVTENRLAAYLALEEQAENAELTDDPEKALTGSLQQKVFYLPKEAVFDLYRTLIPFWYAMRSFRDSKGQDINVFNHPVFGNFYTKAPWVEANMQLLLQGHPQALELLLPELKKILASPSVTINVDEKNPVGTLRFAHPTNAPEKSLVGWTKEHSDVSTMRDSKVEQALIFYMAGQAYLESNSALTEVQDYLTRALTLFQNNNKILYSAEILHCYLGLSWGSWLQQNSASAKSHHAKALQLIQTQFGKGHPYYAECKKLDSYLQQKPGQIPNLKLPERIGNWHIPPDNQHFVGRTETLKKLTAHFKPAQAGMKICFLSTISGLGGIGKTQVALKFLHHSGHDYALRLWFRAEQEHTLLQDYIELAERFRLMAMGERLSKEEVIERVKKYLENNPDWLAVYDNATNYVSIKQFLPTRGGHVVITTRYSKETLNNELKNEKAINALTLEIDKFIPEEALQYLKEMTERSGVEEEQAMHALAKELDYLPLALAQAAAYIKRGGITIQDYRERYKTSQQYLLKNKLLPADSHSLPVATTWETTLRAIQEEEQNAGESPLALAVLQAMSYVYADQIPQSLLAQWLKVTHLVTEKDMQSQLKKVLDRLATYSMIQKNDSKNEIENTVSIHRLVQEVIRSRGLQQQVSGNLKLKFDEKTAEAKINSDAKSAVINYNKVDNKIAIPQPKSKSEEEKKKEQEKEVALDQAFHLKQQSKRIYQQSEQNIPSKPIDFKIAEDALRRSIAIYQQYKDSYAGELCDTFLDLALLLHAQGTNQSQQAAQKCLADAKQSLVRSYGKADAKQSRCKTVEWYLDAKRDNSIFAVKTYASFDTWQLPPNNNEFFVGRESLIEKLNQHCKPNQAYQMLVLSAVSGLGGVGKTQLAIYYLYHAKHQYNLRVWFRAENASLLLSDYRSFAKEFDLIPVDEKTPKEEIIGSVKRYLERHPDWLAVYDNAGSRDEIREFLPTKGGHLIVTTRRQEYDDVGIKVAVDVFTEQEAVAYLKKLTGITNQEKEMAELAKTLGYLPLAIGQAGAYIKKQKMTVQQYLNNFKQSAVKLLEAQQLALDNRSETVATTWNISLKAIEQDEEKNNEPHLSLPVLQAMAHLDPEDIPRDILEKWLRDQKLVVDTDFARLALDKVIGRLLDYSLIYVNIDNKTVSIHRLVQEVIRMGILSAISKPAEVLIIHKDRVILAENHISIIKFLDGLATSLSNNFVKSTQAIEDERRKKTLFPHAETLIQHYDQQKLLNAPPSFLLSVLLSYVAQVLSEQLGNASRAQGYQERALKISEQHHGPSHWKLAAPLLNLAINHGELGKEQEKRLLLERASEILEGHQGKYPPELINTITMSLANSYGALGDTKKRKFLLEILLEIFEAQYGVSHLAIVNLLTNLADVYGEFGRVDDAKCLLERALKILKQHYGANHWRVAKLLGSLATAYGELGDMQTKKQLIESAIAILKQQYGVDHWEVANLQGMLGDVYYNLGNTKVAIALLENSLNIFKRNFGDDHWRVAQALNDYALICGELGDTEKKKNLLEQGLKIQEKYYGFDHWRIVITLTNLAAAYGDLGKGNVANSLLERALKAGEQHYGIHYHKLANILMNIAANYGQLGETQKKKNCLLRTIEIQTQHYGIGDWRPTDARAELAAVDDELGDTQIAKSLLQDILKTQEKHYGFDHWKLAGTICKLANTFAKEDPKTAKTFYERALKIEEQHYGYNHWQVAATLMNLANTYGELGDETTNQLLLKRALKIQEKHYGLDHSEVAITVLNLAMSCAAIKDWPNAYLFADRACRSFTITYKNSNHPYVQKASKLLQQLTQFFSSQAPQLLMRLTQHINQEQLIKALCKSEILELLEKRSFASVRQLFQLQHADYDNYELHFALGQQYIHKQNTLGAIKHFQISMELAKQAGCDRSELANIQNNLGSLYHCYACEQKPINNISVVQDALKQSNDHFKQSLQLDLHIQHFTAYANYLLQQDCIVEAIQQLERVLNINKLAMASDVATEQYRTLEQDGKLNYGGLESLTLDTRLQMELDFWQEIDIKATTFAYYLLITAYHQQNNVEAARKIVMKFQQIAVKENDPLTFSLLGHTQQLIKDYTSAAASYQQAFKLMPGYIVAERQLKQCQALLSASVAQSQSSQAAADAKGSGDSKLSLASLAAIFSSAATAAAPADPQPLNSATAVANSVPVAASDNKDAKVNAKVDGDKKSGVRR